MSKGFFTKQEFHRTSGSRSESSTSKKWGSQVVLVSARWLGLSTCRATLWIDGYSDGSNFPWQRETQEDLIEGMLLH